MRTAADNKKQTTGLSEFSRRKEFKPPSLTKPIMTGAIIFSIIGAALMFFVEPHFIFAGLAVSLVILLIFKYPILGLYCYLIVSLLRPQDLFHPLAAMRPNISILVISLVSIAIHKKIKGTLHLKLVKTDYAFLIFLGAVWLSNLTSFWVTQSLNETLEFFKLVPFYLLAIMLLDSTKKIERYLRYCIYCMLFVCLVQIYTYHTIGLIRATGVGGYGIIFPGGFQLGGIGVFKESVGPVYGVGGYSSAFLGNASELGLAAVMYLPVAWYIFKINRSKLLKTIFFLSTLVLIYSVQVCGSRGALVGLVATLLFMLYKEKKLLIGIVCMLILAGPLIMLAGDQYQQRISSIAQGSDEESANIRITLWKAGMRMIAANPVFGMGISNFSNAYGGEYREKGSRNLYWSPHNIIIQIAAETGLVGLAAYIFLIYAIWRTNRAVRRKAIEFPEKSGLIFKHLSNGLDAALVGYLVAGQFITATYYPHLFQIAFLSSSLYLAVRNKEDKFRAEAIVIEPEETNSLQNSNG